MEAKRSKQVVSLPEEIIFEVLARLPAKPLCRFRCVSKGWCALISDRPFVAAHRSRADPYLVGVFCVARRPPEVRVMDMDGNVVRVFTITPSTPPSPPPHLDDLIYVDGTASSRYGGMIVDPAAGRACNVFEMSDPVPWAVTYGGTSFGHAVPSGAFKVLLLQDPYWRGAGGGHQLCEVTTIMDGVVDIGPPIWRRRSPPPFATGFSFEEKATVNGVVYFMPYGLHDDTAQSWNRIAVFDLESEKWNLGYGSECTCG